MPILISIAAPATLAVGCAKKKTAAATPAPQPEAGTANITPGAPAARSTPSAPAASASTPSRYPDAATRAPIADSSELRDIVSRYPDYKLTIEGHCDERGSEEYNLALGDARAKAAQDYLVGVGVAANQLNVVSHGKDKPLREEHDEACRQKNRRIRIAARAQ